MAKDASNGAQLVAFVGENLRTELRGNELHIIVPDVRVTVGESKSGKSSLVAISGGNRDLVRLPSGQIIKGGINLYLPKPPEIQPAEPTASA